jgi:hypothetical protein
VRFRSRVWLEPGLETDYVLIARPGRAPVLRQVGAVALYGGRGGPGHYRGNGYGYYGGGYNSPAPYPGGSYGHNGPHQGNGGYPGGSYNNGNYNNSGPGSGQPGGAGYYPGSSVSSYRALAPQDVDAAVRAIRQSPSEANKLSTAKEALAERSLRAEDLQRLLETLGFEASRVELAKFAYPHVADPENFERVYDAFEFDASVQEVQEAVEEARQR